MPVIQSIPQMYCPTCHLSTRMDIARCLHCRQLLKPVPVKAIKQRAKLQTSARSDGFRLKVRVPAKRRQSRVAITGKSKSRHR